MQAKPTSLVSSSLGYILIVAVAGISCVLMAEATPVVASPRIVTPKQKSNKIWASPGKQLVIPCKADPGFPDEFTMIYWLVNSSFIEKTYPDGRVKEGKEGVDTKCNKSLIRKDLVFKTVTDEDFEATYSCVVNNPAGRHIVHLKLKRFSPICTCGCQGRNALGNIPKSNQKRKKQEEWMSKTAAAFVEMNTTFIS